ncbi:MAG: hypothetical protein ACUVXI_02710 [bacterium]
MAYVSSSMLRGLYKKGSLRNEGDGFQFALYNNLGYGSIVGLESFKVDGESIPIGRITFQVKDKAVSAKDISASKPQSAPMYTDIVIKVAGKKLSEGSHTISMRIDSMEAGKLDMDFEDKLSA